MKIHFLHFFCTGLNVRVPGCQNPIWQALALPVWQHQQWASKG